MALKLAGLGVKPMKNFFLGVLATAMAAVLAYIGQIVVDRSFNTETLGIFSSVNSPSAPLADSIITSASAVANGRPVDPLARGSRMTIDEYDIAEVKMTLIEVFNFGDEPYGPFTLKVVAPSTRGSGVIDFVEATRPSVDVAMEINNGDLVLNYGPMGPQEGHRLWVSTDIDADIAVRPRDANIPYMDFMIDAGQWRSEIRLRQQERVEQVLAIFVSLLIGVLFCYLALSIIARRRGRSLSELFVRTPIEGTSHSGT